MNEALNAGLDYLNPFTGPEASGAPATDLTPEQLAQMGISPEQLAQMTPEQLAGLQAQYESQYAEQANIANSAPGSADGAPYYGPELPVSTADNGPYDEAEPAEEQATETLSEVLERSIQEARRDGAEGMAAAETALHNKEVTTARDHVKEALDDRPAEEVAQIQREAIADALKNQQIAPHNTEKIAAQADEKGTLAPDAAPATTPVGERVILDGSSTKVNEETGRAQRVQGRDVEARNNGMTKWYLRRMRDGILGRIKTLGINTRLRNTTRNQDDWVRMKLAPEAAYVGKANGSKLQDITRPERAEWAADRIVGEEVLSAITTPRKQTPEFRQTMQQLAAEDPETAKVISLATRRFKQTGTIDRRSARRIGNRLQRQRPAA